jgi:hypothetical protein
VTGPLEHEARALVEAARDWVVRTVPESHAAECQWCPVCRTAAVLRDPEVADRVAGVVSTAASTLAGLLDTLTRPAEPPPPPPARPAGGTEIPLDGPPAGTAGSGDQS